MSQPNLFIRLQDMSLVIHVLSLLLFSRLFAGFCVSSLEEASFSDYNHADQCVVYGLSTDRLTAHPYRLTTHLLQQWWKQSFDCFPQTTSGCDAEHVHSTPLVDHGEGCSKWPFLSCLTAGWSWPHSCSSLSVLVIML